VAEAGEEEQQAVGSLAGGSLAVDSSVVGLLVDDSLEEKQRRRH